MIAPLKRVAGGIVAALDPQCRFERAIFLLGHMRCGSTALSNVLCTHSEISGYGEAHIRYDGRRALGELVLNQARRGCWRLRAGRLFDKILHSRYDMVPAGGLNTAKAIFVVREPGASIASIRTLFTRIGSGEYRDDGLAADYYERRLEDLATLWDRFAPTDRLCIPHHRLTAAPQSALDAITAMTGLHRPLENRYRTNRLASERGAGDPLTAGRFAAIVPAEQATSIRPARLDLPSGRIESLRRSFERFVALTN